MDSLEMVTQMPLWEELAAQLQGYSQQMVSSYWPLQDQPQWLATTSLKITPLLGSTPHDRAR